MRVRRTLLVAVAAICMPAFAAGVAQANQFIAKAGATEEGEFKIDGASGTENPQVFRVDDMEIVCTAGREQGTLIAPNETFEAQLQVKDCTTEVHDGALTAHAKVAVKGPLSLSYYAGGAMHAESSITFDIKALGCELTLSPGPEGAPPGPTRYGNESVSTTRLSKFPSGFQHKLKIDGELRLTAAQTTPGSCPEIENLGTSGGDIGEAGPPFPIYQGTIFDEVKSADLGYEEEETPPGGWNKVTNVPE